MLLGGDTCQKSEGEHLQNDGYFLLEGGIEVAFISFCFQPCPHLSEQILNLESVSFVSPIIFLRIIIFIFFCNCWHDAEMTQAQNLTQTSELQTDTRGRRSDLHCQILDVPCDFSRFLFFSEAMCTSKKSRLYVTPGNSGVNRRSPRSCSGKGN